MLELMIKYLIEEEKGGKKILYKDNPKPPLYAHTQNPDLSSRLAFSEEEGG